jgi:hypothetical protein
MWAQVLISSAVMSIVIACADCGEPLQDKYLELLASSHVAGRPVLAAGAKVCVSKVPQSGGEWCHECCGRLRWEGGRHCCFNAPSCTHSERCDPREASPGKWVCRRHRSILESSTLKALHKPGKYGDCLPPWPHLRLLSGAVSYELFERFCFELSQCHANRRNGNSRPYSYDCIVDSVHFDSPHDELSTASLATAAGLAKVIRAMGPDVSAVEKMAACLRAAFGAARLGSADFRSQFLDALALDVQVLREPLPNAFNKLALDVAARMFDARCNPFTQAHLPQSAAHAAVQALWCRLFNRADSPPE